MATRSDLQGPYEGFDWKLFCQMPSCPFNTDGIKISSWWLFLCICYLSCFLIGIIFTVNGFASMGNEMAAVGVGLVIVGASLAIVCDVLRRLGVGWTKIVPESPYPSRQFVHTSGEFGFPIPFLPGYPGFCSGGEETRCNSPPPYVNSPHVVDLVARPTITCINENESQGVVSMRDNPTDRYSTTSETPRCETSITENLRQAALVLVTPTGIEHRTLNPPPPPYDFASADREDRISWLYDTPPPYGDFV